MSPEETAVGERLRRLIEDKGSIPVAQYMAAANAHYYATRDPLGTAGDFITAPEISQMFGELVGVWLADLWTRAGRPDVRYVELGPGRGTLAADALRAMRSAGLEPPVEFVETSPILREAQRSRVGDAHWHDDVATLPGDRPLLIVANEFFDALPVHQFVATQWGWRERMVSHDGERFVPVAGAPVAEGALPAQLRAAPAGTILETSPASEAIVRALAARLVRQGGAVLIVDYGHARAAPGDSLQAVEKHDFADPWTLPGERDLTAHVDFEALGAAARSEGVRVRGPVGQGEWLKALGIDRRAATLAKASPGAAESIEMARRRLVDPEAMGSLFKVMALVSPDWPEPAGLP